MTAELPASLPPVTKPERHETNLSLRYDFNYCTYSYTMAFWDWARWEKEIDWMALHGINLPLAAVGQECVWRNMLAKLGYTKEETNRFIAGPAFLAWWAMNNLEGWGGPNPDSWYTQQEALQKKILKRMREYGIEPRTGIVERFYPSGILNAYRQAVCRNRRPLLRGTRKTLRQSQLLFNGPFPRIRECRRS